MGARIRSNGEVVCAAMHPEMPGDTYIDDGELYHRVVEAQELIATPTHLHAEGCDGVHCDGSIIGASGSRLCGDGIWLVADG